MINILLSSQEGISGTRNEQRLVQVFLQSKENPEMARGLQYFLKKSVSKTELAGTEADRETVKWGCNVARDLLRTSAASEIIEH